MSDRKPLMPKATAAWLVENTALTFDQIADFCQMHLLEIKGIADGDVAAGIKGMDPISSGQLTREEIQRGEANSKYRLRLAVSKIDIPPVKTKRGPRYTPVSRRHDRPNAVVWLLRNHPELRDSQIMRLVGTTKPTITQVRDRTHWNSANLVPQDPVTLGLCSQIDLDEEVRKAAKRAEKERPATHPADAAGTLLPVTDTTGFGQTSETDETQAPEVPEPRESEAEEAARVLASLQGLTDASEPSEQDEEEVTAEQDVAEEDAEEEDATEDADGEDEAETTDDDTN